jgi:hypothetical protein
MDFVEGHGGKFSGDRRLLNLWLIRYPMLNTANHRRNWQVTNKRHSGERR